MSCIEDNKVAYVVDDIYEIINLETNTISIDQYLDNIDNIKDKIKNKSKFLVCKNNHLLIKYKSNKRQNHFKHIYNPEMTEWHKNWQNEFEEREIKIGNNRADAKVNNKIIEFQYSCINANDVMLRKKTYTNDNNYELIWVIECNSSVKIQYYNTNYLIIFKKDIWKFENFKCNDYIFLDHNSMIFRINPSKVKSNMISVMEYNTRNDFIKSIKDNINIWKDLELPQCILYHNQRGAGCGKTYESVQLLHSDIFDYKSTFIYLTKMHSAREVINVEFIQQYGDGKENIINHDIIQVNSINNKGKQTNIKYFNKKTTSECNIIIGTIDSFMYALGNKNHTESDYFSGIVNSIRKEYLEDNDNFVYRNNTLNKKCLIIIDEAQDLNINYLHAICAIMNTTYIDVYIIGDKLQSLYFENNIHTYLEVNDLPGVNIIKSEGINKVMRFHNDKFKDFVNNLVDFEAYKLPKIESTCNIQNCKYTHNSNIPYKLIKIDNKESKNDEINITINEIINHINYEIELHNYLPNNFMFIFPILKSNNLAIQLESTLQDFWMKKFEDTNYIEKTKLKENPIWKEDIETGFIKYIKFIYLHKSEEGRPINLKESENASRILSIHASKGNGCEVVFLLDINEKNLKKFSGEKNNLITESLLHVALTRQKQSLYIFYKEDHNDNIYNRLIKSDYIKPSDYELKSYISKINKSVNIDKISEYICNNTQCFNIINETFQLEQYKEQDYIKKINLDIIDYGHHIIRRAVLDMGFKLYLLFKENYEKVDDQFRTILQKMVKTDIKIIYNVKDFYGKIKDIKEKKMKGIDPNEIPILCYKKKGDYRRYTEIIGKYIGIIKSKIKNGFKNNTNIRLCTLERVILYYMYSFFIYKSEISINDVFSIIKYYNESSSSISKYHIENNDCMCKKYFMENNKKPNIPEFLHYEKLEMIENMYNEYKKKIIDIDNIKHLVTHKVSLKDQYEFDISNLYDMIGYSNTNVMNIMISPQFNNLNYIKLIVKSILCEYILIDPASHKNECNKIDNIKRFKNKNINHCILNFETQTPIFIKSLLDEGKIEIIKNIIIEYLKYYYGSMHTYIYDFYQNISKNNLPNAKLRDVINELKKNNYKNLPNYIKYFFHGLKGNKKNQKYLNNKQKFCKILDHKLEDTIEELFDDITIDSD